ncbi:hypothetical protein [Paenibacillus kribbensis]|uniref:hypothetical protein n=1 Tax=Paenibacillus kribbensis TaxID=172713 RepID=UPI000837AB21|nr:hypothetical protein [Paenibacillus kribbensis]
MRKLKMTYYKKPVLLFLIFSLALTVFLGMPMKLNAEVSPTYYVTGIDGKKYVVGRSSDVSQLIVYRNDVQITTISTGGKAGSDYVEIQTYSFSGDTLNISVKWKYSGNYQTYTVNNVSKIKDQIVVESVGYVSFDFPRDSTQRQVKVGRKGIWKNVPAYNQPLSTNVINQMAYARATSSSGELMEATYTTPFSYSGETRMFTEGPDGVQYTVSSLQLSAGTATIYATRPDGTNATTSIYKNQDLLFPEIRNMYWSGNNLNVGYQWKYSGTRETATFYNLASPIQNP